MPRRLARAPIAVFRAGFGWIFGGAVVMLQHRGRRSGLARYVVLEVVRAEPDAVVVPSGYGRSSQWFRNVMAEPRVWLWRGARRPAPAYAQRLGQSEVRQIFEDYRCEHPLRARALARTLGIEDLFARGPVPHDIGDRIPLVRVRT
ncbi:nitroreductase family deazaflavin-dependent oxidoreductase [Georgenia deserti]|uniref:Nitroreductase family deazaflavin-dependent oxidoreductase n=1 Tax=Georgenia deserti TaxID=2093781 RepID=A0ABW4L6U2_9MICO